MNLFAVSSLVTVTVSLSSGLFAYLKNRKAFLNRIFALLMFSIAVWSFGLANLAVATNELNGLFWDRFLYFGSLFIPTLFFHFVLTFLGLRKEKEKLLIAGYIFSFLFLMLNFTPLFRERMVSAQALHFNYLPETGPVYPVFPLMFFFYVGYSLYLMFKRYRRISGVTRNQIKYAFLAAIIGFGGGSTTFLPAFGIKTSPIGNCFVALYGVILAYAIVTYRLMDIEVVINKTVLFGILIGGIVGFHISFVTIFQGMIGYDISTALSAGIIVFGLFFTPFRRKLGGFVDALVYRGKYDYQKVLRESTKALVTMLDLRQLLNYIVGTISNTVGVEKVSLFLREEGKRRYEIRASCGLDEEFIDNYVLKLNDGIIPWLKQSKAVFIKEEMERALPGKAFENIYGDMEKIGAEFILPLFYKDNLVGVLNLSNKQSGGIYNQTDIDILECLGSQAAVAIENARLHTEVITDELTELYQPRYFELRLREEIEEAKRYKHCLSLMMVEADSFEEIKKRYGEEERDKLLKSMAGIVKANLRVGDIACRCSEKELGIILPEITEESRGDIRERLKKQIKETVEIGERLRRRVEEEELSVSISIGIASFDGQDREMKRETLIKQVREALSQARKQGNTVKVFYDEKLRKEISTEVLEWIKETEETLVSGDLCVDLIRHTVQVKGKPVELTPKAFNLLCLLMKKKGRVLNRSFLTESIWGYEYFGTTRTVDSHVKTLRQKLGSEGKKIKTIEGIGYKFTDESE